MYTEQYMVMAINSSSHTNRYMCTLSVCLDCTTQWVVSCQERVQVWRIPRSSWRVALSSKDALWPCLTCLTNHTVPPSLLRNNHTCNSKHSLDLSLLLLSLPLWRPQYSHWAGGQHCYTSNRHSWREVRERTQTSSFLDTTLPEVVERTQWMSA